MSVTETNGLGINKFFIRFSLLMVCVAIVLIISFVEKIKDQSLNSDKQLVNAIFNIASTSLVEGDKIGLRRVLQAFEQRDMYIKIIYNDGSEVQWPRELFSPIWNTTPDYRETKLLGPGQPAQFNIWHVRKSKTYLMPLALFTVIFILTCFLAIGGFQHLKLWREDISSLNAILNAPSVGPSRIHFNFIFFKILSDKISENRHLIEQKSRFDAKVLFLEHINKLSRQVAHDIRSPLSAMQIAASQIQLAPKEAQDLIEKSAKRIQQIAEDLLNKNRHNETSARESMHCNDSEPSYKPHSTNKVEKFKNLNAHVDLGPICKEIIEEKKILFDSHHLIKTNFMPPTRTQLDSQRNTDISETNTKIDLICAENIRASSSVVVSDLKRILSNLINNSIEACSAGPGKVSIVASQSNRFCTIQIIDTGKGIPAALMNKIGEEGFTYGKENGNGLGLHHAMQTVKSWGGKLTIQSKENVGTTVTLTLPAYAS